MKKIFLIITLFISVKLSALNYYVSSSGNDANNGTSTSSAWQTLSKVNSSMSSFVAGDVISFKRGDTFTGRLILTKSGVSGNPIIFTNYGSGNIPVFLYPLPDGTPSKDRSIIYCFQKLYITVNGIKLFDNTIDPNDRTITANVAFGVELDGASHVTIKNCDMSLVGTGVYIADGTDNNTVDSCTIHNLRMIVNTVGGDDDYGANGVIISGSNNVITNNYFLNCWANSYDYTYDGGAVEIYGSSVNGNIIMYNTAVGCDGFMEIGSGNSGTCNNTLCAYNLIVNNGSLVYMHNSGSFAITVSNLQFFNNNIIETAILLEPSTYMIGMETTSSASNIVSLKNNIFDFSIPMQVGQTGKFTGSQLTRLNNIYKLSGGATLGYTINGTELSTNNTLFTDQAPVDPYTWNYVLKTGSEAIRFGVNLSLTRDIVGNIIPVTPDAGAFQSTGNIVLQLPPNPIIIRTNAVSFPIKITKTSTGIRLNPYSKSYTVSFAQYETNAALIDYSEQQISVVTDYTLPAHASGVTFLKITAIDNVENVYINTIKVVY